MVENGHLILTCKDWERDWFGNIGRLFALFKNDSPSYFTLLHIMPLLELFVLTSSHVLGLLLVSIILSIKYFGIELNNC